jgi:hypothetical protein
MSIERSRKDSSREETVSHVKHRVSLVRTPSKSLWTIVDDEDLDPVELGNEARELETDECALKPKTALGAQSGDDSCTLFRSSSVSSAILFNR